MGLIIGGIHREEVSEKSLAIAVMNLLSYIYVQGVKDACNARDEMLCRDFIAKTDEAGVFGFLWKPRDVRFDMNTWNDRDFMDEIISFIHSERVPGRDKLKRYLQRILSPKIYHFCLLHVAQEFYKRGMLDYLKYPNPTKLFTITQSPMNMAWESNGGKKGTRQDTLHRIHEACRDRALRCEESLEKNPKNKYATGRTQFDNFQKSFKWALSNEEKPKKRKKIYRVVEIGGWRPEDPEEKLPILGKKRGRPPKSKT